MTHRIYQMRFSDVYKALVAKAERKGKTAQEVHELASWLTGYHISDIEQLMKGEETYGDFFRKAPKFIPFRENITGRICGVQIETIEDPLMQEIRRLDKLVDWLAKGKTAPEIIAKYQKG